MIYELRIYQCVPGRLPVLLKRFERKPGLIAQLAGQIMALSGFDDEDVRDALSARG